MSILRHLSICLLISLASNAHGDGIPDNCTQLIFGIAPQHGATITLVVAAGFAAAASLVSLMRISRSKTPATA